MKSLYLLCATSLVLNGTLAFVLLHSSPGPSATTTTQLHPAASKTGSPDKNGGQTSPELAGHWAALYDKDLARYTANLRAAGLSEQLVRRLISAEIDEQFRAREEALRPPRKHLKYWQTDSTRLPMETQLALLDLRREKARLRAGVLGPEATSDEADDNPIPPAKREMLKLISEDYDTMINPIRGQGSMLLAAEKEKIKYLEAEKKRELAELLTPEEQVEYEKRTSSITQQLRWQLKDFEASDAEFNAIYAAEKSFQERAAQISGPEPWKAQEEAFESLAAQLKAQLGESRYADYARARDNEYQQLAQLVQRTGLPISVAASVFDLREAASKQSAEIFGSKTLSLEEKKSALETLAAATREKIKQSLGNEAAEAYLTTANRWLTAVARGKIVFSNFGRNTSTSSLSPPSPRNSPGR